MGRCIFLLVSLIGLGTYCQGQNPVSHPDAPWLINETFTNEFNTDQLNLSDWDNNVNDWGTWSWEPDNAYITDSVLTLRMVQKTHTRNGKEFYFTSGIYRNRRTFTYGYFEARIKASEKGQGSCPAFWMYSVGQPTPTEEGGVKYCEIDAVEIFQVPYDSLRLEMNLHTRIIQNGVLTWIRPGQGHTELTHNTWLAPWDPRDDYHTYGVLSRVDSIFWYVDGVQRGAKKNHYWHLPMYLTVSMGLRTPYERYINGVRTVMPYPDSIPEEGFPTEMYCDYVRVWNTDPQLYADYEKYYDAAFPINNDLEFDCRYFAGNGQTVVSDNWNGISCKLQEIQNDGTVVREFEEVDATAIGRESGKATFRFSLSGLAPSSSLPAGNRYVLKPVFRTSQNGGEDVYLKEDYYPVQLVMSTKVNDFEAKEKIKIINRADGVGISLTDDLIRDGKIMIHDLSGRQVYISGALSNSILVDKSVFPSSGIYFVSVMAGELQRVEKIAITSN